jgi:DNA-binding SARP family transcriptional activator
LYKQEELILRIRSCSETISQAKKLLEQNSIRLDVQEHLYTLQKTLDNLDAENLDENDVKNIESAINRALKAISEFFPEGTLMQIETSETH